MKSTMVALFLSLSTAMLSVAHAAQSPLGDLSLPIQIQSDHASFEHHLKQATHEGNVILKQGTHELHADKLVLKKDAKGEMDVFIATGKPATFTGLMTNDPNPVTASANTIYFYPHKKLIVFEGNATLVHQQDKFKGPTLSYQIDKQAITATANQGERPTIVIQPRQTS